MFSMKSDVLFTDTVISEIIELHPFEMELLKALRHKWRFGEVTILMRNGLPFRLVRVQEFIDLTKGSAS
jgi:hypothetical protein